MSPSGESVRQFPNSDRLVVSDDSALSLYAIRPGASGWVGQIWPRDQRRDVNRVEDLGIEPGRFVYVTLHRPANVDERANLTTLMRGLGEVSRRLPVVFPIHPRTRKMLTEFGFMPQAGDRMHLLDPLGYHASLCLTENARAVLTDSGGLQEEATFFRTPCLTLRPNTERPVTVTLGSNRLTKLSRLLEDIEAVLAGPGRLGQVPPLWDGHAAERSLKELIEASSR